MSFVPSDFGGFVGVWDPRGILPHALIVRFARGQAVESEGLRLTPLNLLQVRRQLDALIQEGEAEGYITAEHRRQADLLPPVVTSPDSMEKDLQSRAEVDEIAGSD